MVERARPCRDLAYVALWLVDAVRVFAWWLMKALVGWGAVLSGDPRPSSEWTADLSSPRALRRDLRFGWEVKTDSRTSRRIWRGAAPPSGTSRRARREATAPDQTAASGEVVLASRLPETLRGATGQPRA